MGAKLATSSVGIGARSTASRSRKVAARGGSSASSSSRESSRAVSPIDTSCCSIQGEPVAARTARRAASADFDGAIASASMSRSRSAIAPSSRLCRASGGIGRRLVAIHRLLRA